MILPFQLAAATVPSCHRPPALAPHEEVMALLGADLAPKDPLPALKYGLFSARFGTPYRHYRATSRDGGEFRGVDVWYRDDLENNA